MEENFELASIVCEIDISTGNNVTAPVVSRRSSHPHRIAEGSHIFKKDDWYYLTTAEGGTTGDHHQCIFRSKNPLGPFEEPPAGVNPIIHNIHHPRVIQTGHADFFNGPDGSWWVVFLALRPQSNGHSQLGRETFLAAVDWDDGWPMVNGGKSIDLNVPIRGLPHKVTRAVWEANFSPGRYTHPGSS